MENAITASAFDHLYDVLEGRTPCDVPEHAGGMDRLIYDSYCIQHQGLPSAADIRSGELHLVFGQNAVTSEHRKQIVRKAVLYGQHSYFAMPYKVRRTEISPDSYDGSVDYGHSIVSVDRGVKELLIELKPYVLKHYITLLPDTIRVPGRDDWEGTRLLRVRLESDYLNEQLAEINGVRLFLPCLKGVPDEALLTIREQEMQEEFADFQRSLCSLLAANVAVGDRALYELMRTVDEHVRRIDDRMKELKRTSWFASLGLTLLPFPLLLAFTTIPADYSAVLKGVVAMLGTRTALSYMEHMQEQRRSKRAVERDPFFVPWFLASKKDTKT